MNTFLPYADYAETAHVLDNMRLNSCINEALVVLRSHTHVYDAKAHSGLHGWEKHTVALFWKMHEYQLIQYALALTTEWFNRCKKNDIDAFNARKKRLQQWRALNEHVEDLHIPTDLPPLIGDEAFHQGMRAFLLFKDCQKQTYINWKNGVYPDHAVTRKLLPRKSSWKREDYLHLWDVFSRPEPAWYSQWGWEEDPDDTLLFYSMDRRSQILKEMERKRERPMVSYYLKYAKHRISTTQFSTTTESDSDSTADNE